MPVSNIQSPSNSVIEIPMPSNVTDAEVSTSKRDRLLSSTASFAAPLKHAKRMSAHYDAMRQAKRDRIAAAQKRKGDALFHRNLTVAEYKKTNHKLTPEATAEDDAIIQEADQEINEESKRKIPVLDIDDIMQRAPSVRNWSPHMTKYFEGDARHCSDQKKEAHKNRVAKEGDLDVVVQAPRKAEDALRSLKAWIRARGDKAKATTSGLLQGFKFDHKGEFELNTNPRVEVHQDWSISTEYSEDRALVEDGIGFLCSVAPDLVEAALTKQILEESDDENAISDADRPALIAAAKAELLAAQRAEEYANKLCERAGIPVFRPSDWPIEVLLEVEKPPKVKPLPVVNAAPVKAVEDDDADAPDFEDAGDDE